jgi:hypothetical protein
MVTLLQPMHLPLLASAACMAVAAGCRRMTHLRVLSIAAAALLVLHGLLAGMPATAWLGLLLLPLHVVRLVLHRRAVAHLHAPEAAADASTARLHQRAYGRAQGYGQYSLPVPTGLNAPQATQA